MATAPKEPFSLKALRRPIAEGLDARAVEDLANAGAFRIGAADAMGPPSKTIYRGAEVNPKYAACEYPQLAVFGVIDESKTRRPDAHFVKVMERVLQDFFTDQDQIERDLASDSSGLTVARRRFEATLSVWVGVCAKWSILEPIKMIAERMGGLSFLENENLWLWALLPDTPKNSFKTSHPAHLAVQNNAYKSIQLMLSCGWDPQKAYSRAPPDDDSGHYVYTYPWQFSGAVPLFDRPDPAAKALLLQAITERSFHDGAIDFRPEVAWGLTRWLAELVDMPLAMVGDPTEPGNSAKELDDMFDELDEKGGSHTLEEIAQSISSLTLNSTRGRSPESSGSLRFDLSNPLPRDLVDMAHKLDVNGRLKPFPCTLELSGAYNPELGLALAHGIHLLDPEQIFMEAVQSGMDGLIRELEPVVDWRLFGPHFSPLGAHLDGRVITKLQERPLLDLIDMIVRNGREDLLTQPFDTPQKSSLKEPGSRFQKVAPRYPPVPGRARPKSFDYPLNVFVKAGLRSCVHACLLAGADPDWEGVAVGKSPKKLAKTLNNQTLEVFLSFEAGQCALDAVREIESGKTNKPGLKAMTSHSR